MRAPLSVPFLDLRSIHAPLRDQFAQAAERVFERGRYLLGPELEAFESAWADSCGAAHAVGVGCGLDALTLALQALGVGPGDEVVVPSNTYIATWLAVSAVGATPVPAEPDPATHLVGADAMAAAVTPATVALVPVHLYGQPVDVDAVTALADRYGLAVLFDAAQAHGATVRGRPVGGFGHASAWSFYPGKNLGALGDGGAVTTDDDALAARIRRLRNYGSDRKYVHVERGANSRLDELQAAFLQVSLAHLAAWNSRRAKVAARYLAELGELSHEVVALPSVSSDVDPAWHLFVVRTGARDALAHHLAHLGIETLIHYPVPPHGQGAYADLSLPSGALPISERLATEVLSLPMGPHLADDQVSAVIDAVRSASL